jgi:sec-independent protein translocase protein TatC
VRRLRPIRHDDRLSVVDHLDELRTRILVSLASFAVAFGICFGWQRDAIIDIANRPLHGREPITLGVAEQFTTTLTLCAYAALLLALPVILYQAYAFVVPAFTPRERRVAMPLMLLIPVLFVGGAVFSYFVVVPAALKFLLHFEADRFNTQIRAREYYGFIGLSLVSVGILFQIPVGVLALTRLGVVSVDQLRRNRRYAVLVIAIVAAALPGVDPVSMIIEMLPLIVLYELSIVLARLFGRSREQVGDAIAPLEGT